MIGKYKRSAQEKETIKEKITNTKEKHTISIKFPLLSKRTDKSIYQVTISYVFMMFRYALFINLPHSKNGNFTGIRHLTEFNNYHSPSQLTSSIVFITH